MKLDNHKFANYLMSLLVNGFVLYYVYYLEQDKCGCKKDWRHDYIKYFSVTIIVLNTVLLLVDDNLSLTTQSFIISCMILLNLVNIYCIYTYIGELDRDKCLCAVKDNALLHNVLYYYRYLLILSALMMFLLFVSSVKFMLLVGRTLQSKSKLTISSKNNRLNIKMKKGRK
jgi:hypothetical protein